MLEAVLVRGEREDREVKGVRVRGRINQAQRNEGREEVLSGSCVWLRAGGKTGKPKL